MGIKCPTSTLGVWVISNPCRQDQLLSVHCGTTTLVICFLATMLDKARLPAKEEALQNYMRDVVSVALRQAQVSSGLDLFVADYGILAVSPSGNVRGLQAMAIHAHKSAGEAWKLQWWDLGF